MRRPALGIALAKAALLVVSLAFSLAVCELLLRSLGYAAIYEVYSNPEMLWQHDPLLGWSHEPHSSAEYVGPRPWPIEFRSQVDINSLGQRGPEPASGTQDGVRILFLGDSMVAGFEVAFEETFVELLEARLARALGRPVEVVNGGVRGYGTDQSFLSFRERGRALAPDVVLLWLSHNDLIDDVTIHRMRRIFGKPAFVLDETTGLRLVASPVPLYPACSEYRIDEAGQVVRVDSLAGRALCRVQLALFDRSALFSFVTTLIPWERWGHLLRDLYYLGMPATGTPGAAPSATTAPPITHHILARMRDEVRAAGAAFYVVGPPNVFESFEEAGIELAPETILSLDRVETADPARTQFKHDSHYTPYGHQLVAEQLAELLIPRLQGDARPGPGEP